MIHETAHERIRPYARMHTYRLACGLTRSRRLVRSPSPGLSLRQDFVRPRPPSHHPVHAHDHHPSPLQALPLRSHRLVPLDRARLQAHLRPHRQQYLRANP